MSLDHDELTRTHEALGDDAPGLPAGPTATSRDWQADIERLRKQMRARYVEQVRAALLGYVGDRDDTEALTEHIVEALAGGAS